MEKLGEKIAMIAVLVVVIAVVLGFLRLAIDHWGYILLAGLAGAGGYYIYTRSK